MDLLTKNYFDFAQELYKTGIISDPWLEGNERFRLKPLIITQKIYEQFCKASEDIGKVYNDLCEIVWENRELIDKYFNLTPFEKLLWLSSNGSWHGIARMDLFLTEDGSIRFCEMNSDTPSGEAEAVILNELFQSSYPNLINPNKHFAEKFFAMILQMYYSSGGKNQTPTIGIVYPTEMPEDLSMITLYKEWILDHGCQAVLGSPFNIIRLKDGSVGLFGNKIDIMLRHYKTDWWCERIPVWSDEEDYPDPDPLDLQLRYILEAELNNRLTVINPFGSVLSQNKITMAFCWDNMNLFSSESQQTIRSYIPESYRLCDMDLNSLNRMDWVLKSDYGCEGDEVILGPFVSEEIWKESLEKAIPEHWIVQRFFVAKQDENNLIPNYGIYLIGGEATGIYTRLSSHATDYLAVTVPTFVST